MNDFHQRSYLSGHDHVFSGVGLHLRHDTVAAIEQLCVDLFFKTRFAGVKETLTLIDAAIQRFAEVLQQSEAQVNG